VKDWSALHFAPAALAQHAIVLVAIGPLLAACVAALSPGRKSAWGVAVLGTAFSLWMALTLAGEVARKGVIDYALGGFAPPLGIAFRADALGVMFTLLIALFALVASLYSWASLRVEVPPGQRRLFQAGFLLGVAGLLGLTVTGDAFNAFVFLEVASIGGYALIASGAERDRRALPAAFTYLIMGTIGATFYMIGVGFLYAATGTLNFVDIASRIGDVRASRGLEAGFALILVGLGLKAAIFPLHGWLPGAYAHAPSQVTVFLSATATKASLYLIVRYAYGVFDARSGDIEQIMLLVLGPLGAAAAIVCSAQALLQTELRRMLAYSSVAQTGMIVLGVASLSATGLSGGLMLVLAHAVLKATLFMSVGAFAMNNPALKLRDFAGAGRLAPWTLVPLAIGAMSLAGIPLTVGFLGKWRLIEGLIQTGQMWAVGVIAFASILTLLYAGRILETVFFRAPVEGGASVREAPLAALVPLWGLALANVFLGLDGQVLDGLARSAAAAAFADLGTLGAVR
jgi:multicomponent Na+:H+ antiporter subunit D